MSGSHSLTQVDGAEYDRIASAMAESERGRWFLAEHSRRNRNADTDVLLAAIARLEGAVAARDPEPAPESERLGRMRGDLMDMAHAISRTKAEIAAINAPDHDQSRLSVASEALDAIVRATERATSDILSAAEDVQEAAWTLRESGSDGGICDELDRRATAIYTACSFQDLTAQRTARIVHTLRYLESRLAAMIAIWGDDAPPPLAEEPAAPASDLSQSDVDRFIDMEARPAEEPRRRPIVDPALMERDDVAFMPARDDAAAMAEREEMAHPEETVGPEEVAQPAEDDLLDIESAFADIDSLTPEEKQALFS